MVTHCKQKQPVQMQAQHYPDVPTPASVSKKAIENLAPAEEPSKPLAASPAGATFGSTAQESSLAPTTTEDAPSSTSATDTNVIYSFESPTPTDTTPTTTTTTSSSSASNGADGAGSTSSSVCTKLVEIIRREQAIQMQQARTKGAQAQAQKGGDPKIGARESGG